MMIDCWQHPHDPNDIVGWAQSTHLNTRLYEHSTIKSFRGQTQYIGSLFDWSIPYYTSSCPLCLLTSDLSQFSYIAGQTSNNTASCKLAACRAEDEPRA